MRKTAKKTIQTYFAGYAGTAEASSGPIGFYDKTAPNLVRLEYFNRNCFSAKTTSLVMWEYPYPKFHIVDFGTGFAQAAVFVRSILDADYLDQAVSIHLYVSHWHHDHIQGFHLGSPLLLRPETTLILHGPVLGDGTMTTENMFNKYSLNTPNWPAIKSIMEMLKVHCEHYSFRPGETLRINGTTIETILLNHPGGSVGYSFNFPGGKKVATGWDYEPLDVEPAFVEHISGADIVGLDMQYRDEEADGEKTIGFEEKPIKRRGWGHGTPSRLLPALFKVKKPIEHIILGHHDPKRPDPDIRLFFEESQQFVEDGLGRPQSITMAHDAECNWA